MPETSIVIRTYNEEKHIGNLLRAIETQDYKDYEIIIVDSGSTDKTLEIAEKHPVRIIKIEKRDFTFGYALNVGCKAARGRYLVFASAHVLPATNFWLSQLIASFKDPGWQWYTGGKKETRIQNIPSKKICGGFLARPLSILKFRCITPITQMPLLGRVSGKKKDLMNIYSDLKISIGHAE